MFSREESKKIRQEFWTSFGKEYPRKWILYNTKIKELQLKFTFTRKIAQVSIDISAPDDLIQAYYYDKLLSLKNLLLNDYLPEAVFDEHYELPEGKSISRVYVQLDGVSIHNKKDWPIVMEFLSRNMTRLEELFNEFSDFLKN
ncbi:DUF4268 domain-containing protein [Salegentibacter chungangensis]|uniref:DUF4268 domain-containing protein n=1 Tax=Salegentibacter chungangensis TaxID=1335724 RepID=A0ABW3NQN9_9FLAO